MKRGWVVLAALVLAAFAFYGCCKGCGSKLSPDLDKVPGMKDSGIPDPKAAEEHSAEVEELSKKIEALGQEQQRIAADPTLSPEEKMRRMEEISKQMEPLTQRMAEIGGDILNKETEVNKDIEEWKKNSGGK